MHIINKFFKFDGVRQDLPCCRLQSVNINRFKMKGGGQLLEVLAFRIRLSSLQSKNSVFHELLQGKITWWEYRVNWTLIQRVLDFGPIPDNSVLTSSNILLYILMYENNRTYTRFAVRRGAQYCKPGANND